MEAMSYQGGEKGRQIIGYNYEIEKDIDWLNPSSSGITISNIDVLLVNKF